MRGDASSSHSVAAEAAAERVNGDRLWQRLMEMAGLGATEGGGVDRQAFTPQDAESRGLMVRWAGESGYEVATDAIGNLFIRRAGLDPDAPPVVGGSHLDSQPTGGKFDGVFGVLAAFETLEALDEAQIVTRRPVEVVSWVNEEGCRFPPVTMGSAVFAGLRSLEEFWGTADRDGTLMGDALGAYLVSTPDLPRRPFGSPIGALIEPHIEQGPVLEQAGEAVGVVEGVQGLRWFAVEITGETAHAGTTPRAFRHDALHTATSLLSRLYAATSDDADSIRFTVGRFEVAPNVPNTVPARVRFTIDLRHPEAQVIAAMDREIHAGAEALSGPCEIEVTRLADSPPTVFDREVVLTLEKWRSQLRLAGRRRISGAGHDAMNIARVAPAAMIFVPCERGVSHHESENADRKDLLAGTQLLAAALTDLAMRD